MQALVLYGRTLARTVFTALNSEVHNQLTWTANNQHAVKANEGLRLIAAASGFSKSQSSAQVLTKWNFGDDACFVAAHHKADVLGKYENKPYDNHIIIMVIVNKSTFLLSNTLSYATLINIITQ